MLFRLTGLSLAKIGLLMSRQKMKMLCFMFVFWCSVAEKNSLMWLTFQAVFARVRGLAMLLLIILVPRLNGGVGIARGRVQGVAGR